MIYGCLQPRELWFIDFNHVMPADDPETRDAWWREIRVEMKAHLKAMGCSVIMGYCENTSIWWDV